MAEGRSPLEDWADDPGVQAAGAAWRAELRAEAEEYERLAALDHLRNRRLADVAAELVARGDTVAVETAGRRFTGVLTYAGDDFACLDTAAGAVDIHLVGAVTITVVARATTGGLPPVAGPGTFRARLAEHEAAPGAVRVGGVEEQVGLLAAVARDHVLLVDADDTAHFIALGAVAWVAPQTAR